MKQVTPEQLMGRWKTDLHDTSTRIVVGEAIQEFFPGGLLMYAVRRDDQTAVMELNYQLEGDWLMTNQPAAPRQDRTRILLDEHGRLILGEGADRTVFVRAPTASFDDT